MARDDREPPVPPGATRVDPTTLLSPSLLDLVYTVVSLGFHMGGSWIHPDIVAREPDGKLSVTHVGIYADTDDPLAVAIDVLNREHPDAVAAAISVEGITHVEGVQDALLVFVAERHGEKTHQLFQRFRRRRFRGIEEIGAI